MITYLFIFLLLIPLFLVIIGTVTKSKWGINIKGIFIPIKCPNCGKELPRVRFPGSTEEVKWGGSTCPNCKTKVDKWGRKLD